MIACAVITPPFGGFISRRRLVGSEAGPPVTNLVDGGYSLVFPTHRSVIDLGR